MGRLRMPDGRRLFGANVVPPAADVVPNGGQQAWSNLMLNWATRWPAWIKPQVDYLCGNGVGANCIRMIGGLDGVAAGLYSQAYHDDNIEQLVSYCRSLGVHFFLVGCGIQNQLVVAIGAGLTPQQFAASQATLINRIAKYDNVIGVDLLQEAQAVATIGTTSFTIPMIQETRRLTGGVLPITCSASMLNTSLNTPFPAVGAPGEGWYLDNTWGRVADYVDFFSGHLYDRLLDNSWFDQFIAAYPQHDILIGEFGRALSAGAASQVSYYERYLGMGTAPPRQVRGALLWAGFDQNTTSDQRWGVYDENFVARPYMLEVVKRFTFGSVAKNNNAVR